MPPSRSIMRRRILLLVCLLCFIGVRAGAAEPAAATIRQTDSAQIKAAIQVSDQLLKRQYKEAQSGIDAILKQWPDDVLGYAGKMIYYQLRNMENFDTRFDREYLKWHEEGRKLADKVLADSASDAWHLFLAGGALSVSGFYHFRTGHPIRAMRDGLKGIGAFEDALAKDPEWIDPLLGLGSYNYWRSVYTKQYAFLPFFPDHRKEGIAMLKTVLEKGEFLKELAQATLAWVYYNEGDYGQALALNSPLIKRNPQNVILRVLQGRIFTQLKRYREAMAEFERILQIDDTLSNVYLYEAYVKFDQAETHHRTAGQEPTEISAQQAKDYQPVIPLLEKFIAMKPAKRIKALAYDLWAEVLFRQQDWSAAKEKTQAALKLDYSIADSRARLRHIRKRK